MSQQFSIKISLTPEFERFVQERIETGRYQTASDVIHEGLRLLSNKRKSGRNRWFA